MEDTLLVLFCAVDEFCQEFIPQWEKTLLQQGMKKRRTPSRFAPSELMTLFIYFRICRYRDFKTYYTGYRMTYLRKEFPELVSYSRMVTLPRC